MTVKLLENTMNKEDAPLLTIDSSAFDFFLESVYGNRSENKGAVRILQASFTALLDRIEQEVIKVPPCNCKHARYIVGEQKQALNVIRKEVI